MTNTLNKDDDLLILSDGNSIDFGDSTTETKVDDDFAFTIMEDESPVLEKVSSTKSELNDLLASTSNSTKSELSDLGNILGISSEKPKVEEVKEEDNLLDFGSDTIILEEEPVKKVESETSNDLSGLLGEITAPKVEGELLVEKAEEKISFLEEDKPETPVILEEPKKEEEKISFADVLSPELQETKTETEAEVKNISNNVFTQVKDISGILASTIGQFVKRAEIVNSEISEKLSHIKTLKAELETEEDLLADLQNEKKAIEINQTTIEKMKNDYENPNSESSKTKKTSK